MPCAKLHPAMTPSDFEAYRHQAVHKLMDLNEECERKFRTGHWARWNYDLDAATLTFSEAGVPHVIARIQAIGSTSNASKTWLWAWANESLPSKVTVNVQEVRKFGRDQGVTQLTESTLPDDEYLGWAMTAIAADIIGAKGAYRCPSEHGFLYVVFTDVWTVDGTIEISGPNHTIECDTHGSGEVTYVCEHLALNPRREWFGDSPAPSKPYPDAWCSECERVYQEQGAWNDANSDRISIKLLCHRCYSSMRAQATVVS